MDDIFEAPPTTQYSGIYSHYDVAVIERFASIFLMTSSNGRIPSSQNSTVTELDVLSAFKGFL